ncbi:4-hydroxyphenylpyruvate dioxygenase [Glaciihabitans tibetensis]|uniref:4-hydroxyphenylpyruvate dioxygenase n=1 Tax=Glaciihabitans tibetensis TaxID=1266600 RepID=A0A2T0VFZ9_9MICO|nr:sugar phosphate isomerase/epimerase family protein [Glaciihabitans tibetensis]PRY69096.1 4-hydroxyphenylpyruvate dioxygenase [Glaciihabitans tibetensis]
MRSPFEQNPLFINTVLLGGTTADKIRAASVAGFDQVELWREDHRLFPGGSRKLRGLLAEQSLGLADLQVLRDFDGAPDDLRASKRREALRFLDSAVECAAPLVLVAASTDPRSIRTRIVEDLQWLSDEAAKRQLRVGYESLSWSFRNSTLVDAWASVREANRDNLGVVVDSFHIHVLHRDESDLDGIPVEKIFLVQLSDLPGPVPAGMLIEVARHRRLLPGTGIFDLRSILSRLLCVGYAGPIGVEVFNDAMKAADPARVARQAMAALQKVLTDITLQADGEDLAETGTTEANRLRTRHSLRHPAVNTGWK